MEIRKAFITGATGMIGSQLVRELLAKGAKVTVLSMDDPVGNQSLPTHENLNVIISDLSKLEEVGETLEKDYDAFFHLGWAGTYGGARNNMELQNRNVLWSVQAAKMAKKIGCQVFLGAGSQAEYGRVPDGQKITGYLPAFPEMGYGIAKLCAGQMTRILCKELGIRHEWVRILSVFGPWDGNGTMVSSGIRKLLKGERPQYTAGEQMWDFLYSKDAARALIAVAENGKDGKVYPVGSGEAKPLKDFILTIRDTVDPKAEIGLGEVPYAPNQVMYLCADISELKADTGFEVKYTFEEGVRETMEWCRDH